MKFSWFLHDNCTTKQAEELVEKYRVRGVKTERSLNADFTTWTISAYLPASIKPPRVDNRWRNRVWG